MSVPQHILRRLGSEKAARRLQLEANLIKKKLEREKGAFSLRRILTVNRLIQLGIRLSGLEKRGFENAIAIQIVENEVFIPSLPAAFDGFRLLQLADLHCDLHPPLMEKIRSMIATIPHDAVVLTGDYHNEILTPIAESLEAMRLLIPHLHPRRFAILGNHDYLEKVEHFEEWGLPVLLNESQPIEKDGQRIWICGVDDAHFFGTHDLQAARSVIHDDEIKILLSHTPETHHEAAALGYNLHLSGHTHGGQICLPGGIPIYHNSPGCRRELLAGAWREGEMPGYTSRGTGCAGAAARFFCPPEVTVHSLRSKSTDLG